MTATPPRPGNMDHAHPHRRASRGFSLVELLVVIGIIAFLATVSTVALAPMLRASKINQAGGMIIDDLNFARQLAISRNNSIEMRFYQLGSSTNDDDLKFRAFRAMEIDPMDPTVATPLTKLRKLPDGLVLLDDGALSPLLDADNPGRSGLTKATETLPGEGAATPYVSFAFYPDGSSTLSPITGSNSNWFLTICAELDSSLLKGGMPDNFVTVQLDPVTGRTRVYKP